MPVEPIDFILNDCLLAAGQGIGTEKSVDFAVVVWWRARYRRFFQHAIAAGNSWTTDRHRVTAVGRYLGQRALHHASGAASIDMRAAELASRDVETGCQMNAVREAGVTVHTATA